MPRARSSESEDVVIKKPRAPRTRVVLNDDESAPAPRKRAPRKVAPKPAVAEVETVVESAPVRKAPTPIAAERKRSARSSRAFIVVAIFCLLLIGGGVGVGLFDQGAIDVMAVVNERNEKIARGEVRDASGQTITTAVPVQADTRPNGGLQMANPADIPAPPPAPEAAVASSSATTTPSTEAAATTTATTTTPS